jgi:hypothetical protein
MRSTSTSLPALNAAQAVTSRPEVTASGDEGGKKKKSPRGDFEIHINTRGCKKPLTRKDVEAINALFAHAARMVSGAFRLAIQRETNAHDRAKDSLDHGGSQSGVAVRHQGGERGGRVSSKKVR